MSVYKISTILSHWCFKAIALTISYLLLVGCSTSKNAPQSIVVQVPNDRWWDEVEKARTGNLQSELSFTPFSTTIPRQIQQNIALARRRMIQVSPIPFTVGFSSSAEINAYAQLENQQNYIIFTQGFILQFGSDPDVLATVMGHELGHHQLGHTQAEYVQDRNVAINVGSQALGILSSYFIPFSGLLVGNVVKGAGLSFSRDDERAADDLGMQWALAAGFSPCGSYRFSAKMEELGKSANIAFLSTHPGNSERMANSEEFTRLHHLALCGASRN